MSYISRLVDEIVDLHDNGFSDEAIAEDLGMNIQDIHEITRELD